MKRNLPALTLFAIAAGLGNAVQAADTGFYGYLAAGRSESDRKAESDRTLAGAGATAFTSTVDASDTGYKLQAGYRFNKYLALEGGYADLGKFAYNATITAPIADTGVATLKVDGWNVGVVGRLPFNDTVTGFAKLGAFVYNADYRCNGSSVGLCGTAPDRTARGTSANYGLGLDFAFAGNWFARIEYEVFSRVGDPMSADGTSGTSREDVRFGSVGVGYRF